MRAWRASRPVPVVLQFSNGTVGYADIIFVEKEPLLFLCFLPSHFATDALYAEVELKGDLSPELDAARESSQVAQAP
jgi:hypothetical protein